MTTTTKHTTGINWDAVLNELKSERFETDWIDNNYHVRRVFLGTVFSLMPSGKYYTPWANSNITEEDAEKDAAHYAMLEAEAEEHGLVIESGESDPCDIFAAEYLEDSISWGNIAEKVDSVEPTFCPGLGGLARMGDALEVDMLVDLTRFEEREEARDYIEERANQFGLGIYWDGGFAYPYAR